MVTSLLGARRWALLVGGLWLGVGLLMTAGLAPTLLAAWGALELSSKGLVLLVMAGQTAVVLVLGVLVCHYGASSARLHDGRTNQAVELVLRREARVWTFAAFFTLAILIVLAASVVAFVLAGAHE